MTVGHLYRGIEDGLRGLASGGSASGRCSSGRRARRRVRRLFSGRSSSRSTDLDSALTAIGEIIEQGEGARGDWQDAHYGRFLGIWEEYHELTEADPAFEPARPVIPAFTRQPFDIPTRAP